MIDRRETRFAVQLLRDQIGRRVYAAHRLDKGTSGVLLFALNTEVARHLGQQFEAQQPEKTYVAVVRGHPPEQGVIDHALTRKPDDYENPRQADSAASQPAITRYQRLATTELPFQVDPRYPASRYALVRLQPETGRRHQLRRHLKHLSHPIIGDATYGKGPHNRFFQQQFQCHRLLLACVELRVKHPVTGRELPLQAPLSPDFAELLQALGWHNCVPASWLPTTRQPLA